MADCNVTAIPQDFESQIPQLQSLNITNWPIGEFFLLQSVSTDDCLFMRGRSRTMTAVGLLGGRKKEEKKMMTKR